MRNKLILFAFAFAALVLLASAVSAYSVNVKFDMDRTGYNYEAYHCTDSVCSGVSPSTAFQSGNTGTSDKVTVSYSTSGTHYTAVYLYTAGYRSKGYIFSTTSSYSPTVTSTFNRRDNSNSTINSITVSPTSPIQGDLISVGVSARSAFDAPSSGSGVPLYEPASLAPWFSSAINLTLKLTNSSGTLSKQVVTFTIPRSTSITTSFSLGTLPAGTYTLNATTVCVDAQCNPSTAIPITMIQSLTVTPAPNHVPVITTSPVTTGTVGVLYRYDVNASDADGDTLTYSLATSPLGMTINAVTGLISWMPSVVGSFSVNVSVSDGIASASQRYTLVVAAAPNHAPVITTSPDTSGTVGVLYGYDVNASDADGDTLTYSLATSPLGMTINAVTGLISWMPSVVGNYSVRVSVSDGIASASQNYTLFVTTIPNNAPVITTLPGTIGTVGVLYRYDVNATDADNNTLNYALNIFPAGMTINTLTGMISWTPSAVGIFGVRVGVSDGIDSVYQSYNITVSNGTTNNTAPHITITSPANGSEFEDNEDIHFAANVSDAEESGLSAVWTSSVDGALGTGNSFYETLSEGTHTITASVTDSGGLSDSYSITLVVKEHEEDDNDDSGDGYIGEYINLDGLFGKGNKIYNDFKMKLNGAVKQSEGISLPLFILMLLIMILLILILLVMLFKKR